MHLDHLIGLPFFKPLYFKNYSFNLASPGLSGHALKKKISTIISPPYFPVRIIDVPSRFQFKSFLKKSFLINGIRIEAFECNHPGKSYAFKFHFPHGKSLVIASDNEPSQQHKKSLINWLNNADVLIHDAQYSPVQYRQKKGWGHSPYTYPIKLAQLAKIRHLILFHYDPTTTDKKLDSIRKTKTANLRLSLSYEGMKLAV